LCCGVAAHRNGASIAPSKPAIVDACVRSFRLAAPGPAADTDASEALRKLQRGCIDLLGLCVATETAAVTSSRRHASHTAQSAKIVVLDADDDDDNDDGASIDGAGRLPATRAAAVGGGGDGGGDGDSGVVLRRVLALMCESDDAGPAPICAANALTSADQHIHQLSGEDTAAAALGHAALMRQSAPALLAVVSGDVGGSVGVRAAAAQALFAVSFRLQGSDDIDVHVDRLIDVACSVLAEDASPAAGPLRMGAVKLIGAVLGRALTAAATSTSGVGGGQNAHSAHHAVTLPGAGLARLHSVLVGVSNMDPSSDVRAVATKLLQAVGAAHPAL
jgi:hypothetical protein